MNKRPVIAWTSLVLASLGLAGCQCCDGSCLKGSKPAQQAYTPQAPIPSVAGTTNGQTQGTANPVSAGNAQQAPAMSAGNAQQAPAWNTASSNGGQQGAWSPPGRQQTPSRPTADSMADGTMRIPVTSPNDGAVSTQMPINTSTQYPSNSGTARSNTYPQSSVTPVSGSAPAIRPNSGQEVYSVPGPNTGSTSSPHAPSPTVDNRPITTVPVPVVDDMPRMSPPPAAPTSSTSPLGASPTPTPDLLRPTVTAPMPRTPHLEDQPANTAGQDLGPALPPAVAQPPQN